MIFLRPPRFCASVNTYLNIFDVPHGTLVEILEPLGAVITGTFGLVMHNGRSNFSYLRVGNTEHLIYKNIKVRKVNDMKIKVRKMTLRDVDVNTLVELCEPLSIQCGIDSIPQGAIGYKDHYLSEIRFVVIANAPLGSHLMFSNPTVEKVKLPITLEEV